jgi:hypothetical protein
MIHWSWALGAFLGGCIFGAVVFALAVAASGLEGSRDDDPR